MWLANTPNGLREARYSRERGICPGCQEEVVGKCGPLMPNHWSHLAGSDCDTWSEPMTQWHKDWQAAAPTYRREVPLGPHRADIVTADGRIYEIQHSALSWDDIERREDFYSVDLVWLWDAREAWDEKRIDITSEEGREVKFYWPQSRRSIGRCRRVVLLDLGPWVLGVNWGNGTMSSGIGHLWEPDVVKWRLGYETPTVRRFPNCADSAARARLEPPEDPRPAAAKPKPCCLCGESTMHANPYGYPQCDECATFAGWHEMASCHACGLPLLYEDAAIDGCHATCIPEETS